MGENGEAKHGVSQAKEQRVGVERMCILRMYRENIFSEDQHSGISLNWS